MPKTRPKDIGTRAETAVVRYLRERGFPGADRKPLSGRYDRSDVNVTAGIVAQIKAGEMSANASVLDIRRWMIECDRQRVNAKAAVNLLVLRQRRRPVSYWHVWTTLRQLDLVRPADQWPNDAVIGMPMTNYSDSKPDATTPVMLLLSDWCDLARGNWGDNE